MADEHTRLNDKPEAVVSLRPVTESDEAFLLGVYASTRAQELAQVQWAEGQKEQFLWWQFDMQRREYEARYADNKYDVILVDDVPAGRIWVSYDDEEIRLLDIALLEEFQNRGIGTFLLRQLMAEAVEKKRALRHMVFVLNNDAARFYERLGFVTFEELGGYKHMEWKPV